MNPVETLRKIGCSHARKIRYRLWHNGMNREELNSHSHHRPGGGFRNPWPAAETHGFVDFLRWSLVERRRNPRRPDPDPASFPRAEHSYVVPRAEPATCTVSWIGHTSFLLQLGGLNVLLDPVWGERASPVTFAGPRRRVPPAIAFDRLPPVDVVCLSHDHYDHLDIPTIRRLTSRYPAIQWFAPLGVGKYLTANGATSVVERDWWESMSLQSVDFTAVPAQHFSGRRLGNRNATLWCGWVIRSRIHSVFFAGDTALHPDFSTIAGRCGPFDMAILPIGAYEPRWFMGSVHMNPEDALVAFGQLDTSQKGRPLVFVASHWGTFKLTDEPMDEPPRRIRELWRGSEFDERQLWVMKFGETRIIR